MTWWCLTKCVIRRTSLLKISLQRPHCHFKAPYRGFKSDTEWTLALWSSKSICSLNVSSQISQRKRFIGLTSGFVSVILPLAWQEKTCRKVLLPSAKVRLQMPHSVLLPPWNLINWYLKWCSATCRRMSRLLHSRSQNLHLAHPRVVGVEISSSWKLPASLDSSVTESPTLTSGLMSSSSGWKASLAFVQFSRQIGSLMTSDELGVASRFLRFMLKSTSVISRDFFAAGKSPTSTNEERSVKFRFLEYNLSVFSSDDLF